MEVGDLGAGVVEELKAHGGCGGAGLAPELVLESLDGGLLGDPDVCGEGGQVGVRDEKEHAVVRRELELRHPPLAVLSLRWRRLACGLWVGGRVAEEPRRRDGVGINRKKEDEVYGLGRREQVRSGPTQLSYMGPGLFRLLPLLSVPPKSPSCVWTSGVRTGIGN
jgi:hypothetical protein